MCFDWAALHSTWSERQETLQATQTDAPYCWRGAHWHLPSLYVSAAFLGDIALDEEDLRMFKVDRIIDLAQRTVKIINHTESGKKVRQ